MADKVSVIRYKIEGIQGASTSVQQLAREFTAANATMAREQKKIVAAEKGIAAAQAAGDLKKYTELNANRDKYLATEQAAQKRVARAISDVKYKASHDDFQVRQRLLDRTTKEELKRVTDPTQRQAIRTAHRIAAAEIAEDRKRAFDKAQARAKRESMGGALSGFGGKMVLGMGIGQLASDAGIGEGIGSIASGFMFGGPAIGTALAGLEIVGSVIRGVRELRAETRAYENDLAGIAAQAQVAGKSTLAVTSLGLERTKERAQIALQAEADRKKHEQEKTDLPWFLNWKLRDISPAGQAISEQEDELYRQSQHLAHQRINARSGDDADEEQRAQIARNRAERAQAVESARLGTTPGAAAEAMRDRLQTTQNESRLQFEINQERKKLLDAQDDERKANAHADLNRQKQDLADFDREAGEKQAASRQEDAYREKARSSEFIFSERNRLSPIFQLNEYRIKLKEAVDHNAATIDEAKMLMQRKVMELYSSVLMPHDFKVGDSRSRLNLAAMNPMMAMVMAGAKIPAYADGTDNHPGGAALVGERGPEVVHLPKGSAVSPYKNDSIFSKMARSQGWSGPNNDYWVDSRGKHQAYNSEHPNPYAGAMHGSVERFNDLELKRANDEARALRRHVEGGGRHSAAAKTVSGPYNDPNMEPGVGLDSHSASWHHGAGYYQSHSMLARVRAGHHARAGGAHGLVDPLTGRTIDTGSFGGTDARGGGPAGAIGQSGQLAQIARQILQIMQAHQGLQ